MSFINILNARGKRGTAEATIKRVYLIEVIWVNLKQIAQQQGVFLNSEIRKKDGITDIKYPISLTQGYKIKGNMRDHVLLFYKKWHFVLLVLVFSVTVACVKFFYFRTE